MSSFNELGKQIKDFAYDNEIAGDKNDKSLSFLKEYVVSALNCYKEKFGWTGTDNYCLIINDTMSGAIADLKNMTGFEFNERELARILKAEGVATKTDTDSCAMLIGVDNLIKLQNVKEKHKVRMQICSGIAAIAHEASHLEDLTTVKRKDAAVWYHFWSEVKAWKVYWSVFYEVCFTEFVGEDAERVTMRRLEMLQKGVAEAGKATGEHDWYRLAQMTGKILSYMEDTHTEKCKLMLPGYFGESAEYGKMIDILKESIAYTKFKENGDWIYDYIKGLEKNLTV